MSSEEDHYAYSLERLGRTARWSIDLPVHESAG
jgi:hypothetical protein